MIIAYYSRTGNVADFLDWYLMPILGERFEARNIEEWDFVDEPYILVTPTYSTEEITEEVADWLEVPRANGCQMIGVVGSGNMNFGNAFCLTARIIEEEYKVPLLGEFELKGSPHVAEQVKERIEELLRNRKD